MTKKAKGPTPPRPIARKEQAKGIVVAPTFTIKLMEALGPSRAARELSTTTTTLHRARNTGKVSGIFEVAAEGLLRKLGVVSNSVATATHAAHPAPTPPTDTEVFFIEAPATRAPDIAKFAKAIGARIMN